VRIGDGGESSHGRWGLKPLPLHLHLHLLLLLLQLLLLNYDCRMPTGVRTPIDLPLRYEFQ
jgi:hypothetical protein